MTTVGVGVAVERTGGFAWIFGGGANSLCSCQSLLSPVTLSQKTQSSVILDIKFIK